MSEPIKIDIWSDIACPWCYIGKRKLETAIQSFAGSEHALDVRVEYHSFELMPEATNEYRGTAVEYVASIKHLSQDVVRRMLDDVTARAAEVGLDFDYDHLQNANTTKALELLHYANAHGVQPEMAERLFRAHFTDGRHVGRIDELAVIAAGIGLDEADVRRSLEAGEYINDVRSDVEDAQSIGIQGVPFYVFDGRYAVSGAQDPTVFASVLERIAIDRAAVLA